MLLSVDFRPNENTFWEKQLWAYPVLLSSWYQSEIPANVCQRKFPSNEKINLLSRRHYWKVTKHISLSHDGGNWKVSWQWAGSTSPSVERNLPGQQTQSVFIPEQLFHLFGDDQQKEGKCYIYLGMYGWIHQEQESFLKKHITAILDLSHSGRDQYFKENIISNNLKKRFKGMWKSFCIEWWWIWFNLVAFAKSS